MHMTLTVPEKMHIQQLLHGLVHLAHGIVKPALVQSQCCTKVICNTKWKVQQCECHQNMHPWIFSQRVTVSDAQNKQWRQHAECIGIFVHLCCIFYHV